MNWKWMTDPNVLAQEGHFLLGYGLALTSRVLFNTPWFGVAVAMLYMIPKELWLDPLTERDPFLWDGALDLGVLTAGAILGALI